MTVMNWYANELLAALPRSVTERIRDDLRTIELRPGMVLHEQGELVRQVYFPHGGAIVCVGAVSENGKLVLAATIGGQGVVGGGSALTSTPECGTSLVQMGGKASAIQADRLRRWVDVFPEVSRLITRYERFVFAQSVRMAACNGQHTLAQRLCRALLTLSNASGLSVLSVTQEALAELLAVRRSSISQFAHALHQAGIIQIRRGQIQIMDVVALKTKACECYVPFEAYAPGEHSRRDRSAATPYASRDVHIHDPAGPGSRT